MKNLVIELRDATFDGTVYMHSSNVVFEALRVQRTERHNYQQQLNKNGIYLLLIGERDVYVGETSKYIIDRVAENHTGTIPNLDDVWHTLIAFPCDKYLNEKARHFLENALCEYFHAHNEYNCVTSKPSVKNCNKRYREKNYPREISTCEDYLNDILTYISHFANGIFPENGLVHTPKCPQELMPLIPKSYVTFYYHNKKQDAHAIANIYIDDGEIKRIVLKKGTKISKAITSKPYYEDSLRKKRQQMEHDRSIIARELQRDDDSFSSPNEAMRFVDGHSVSAPQKWMTENNIPLQDFLSQ